MGGKKEKVEERQPSFATSCQKGSFKINLWVFPPGLYLTFRGTLLLDGPEGASAAWRVVAAEQWERFEVIGDKASVEAGSDNRGNADAGRRRGGPASSGLLCLENRRSGGYNRFVSKTADSEHPY